MDLVKCTSLLSLLLLSSYSHGSSPSVKVLNGVLNGTHEVSYNGKTFSAFRGIPYAKPPVGDLRFEPPQKMTNWTGVWVANTKTRCLQIFNLHKIEVDGDEDCLYLNVYVPRANPSVVDDLDVIVDIHGGAFMLGSGVFYAGPNFLMDEEVILVTINYRLGPFGFLSTHDEVVPGNNGLKDQSFALKWVKENIEFFGGNPDSVTLTGMSAGAASVHFHYFSPLSKGYFHRGMSTSGTALSPWALQTSPLEKTKALAELVGCYQETTPELVQCLRERSAFSIIENVPKLFYHDAIAYGIFKPVVEQDSPTAFLIDTPYNLLVKKEINDAPWITSFTKDEGVFPAGIFKDMLGFVEQNWEEFLPVALDYIDSVPPQRLNDVTLSITEFYLKEQSLSYENLVEIFTDGLFAVYMEKAARLQAKSGDSPVYAYILEYRGQHTFAELYSKSLDNTSVAHGDDVLYFFHTELTESEMSQSDEEMKNFFVNLITTYASTGVPEIGDANWEPVDGNSKAFRYLKIGGPQDISLERVDELTTLPFWESLPLNELGRGNKFRDEL